MLFSRTLLLLPAGLLLAACSGGSGTEKAVGVALPPKVPTSPSAAKLELVATSDTIWNGVAVADDGRTFVLFPHNEGGPGTRIGELKDGKVTPWPNRAWNNWQQPGDPAKQAFVRANSLRFGPEGYLWIVDTGTPKSDVVPVKDGPKLLAFDISKNQLVKSIDLYQYTRPKSFVDDLRFHGEMIYVTDAGAPGLIVLNQKTGQGRRLLNNDSTTTARRPMYGEGKMMLKPNGDKVALHADQMEVSPDGQYYYYQTAAGPMYRVETRYLDDPNINSADLAKKVTYFFNSPTCGGTAIDADGNLYVCDANEKRILKVTPAGQSSVLVQDPRLIWADALWIDQAGALWIPVPQMNRTAGFQRGLETVKFPVELLKMELGLKPFRD
ncbi:L-dopachrome tautomerase-related protein [Hymenobacter sp. M29]|uniref:L-dopachrome tautomerase-related protein n=1 Tax=Hymenobacter mellowenesis TaxID=3063995 RepID=A0ABT9A9Y1_9BACT|nr:L-dopachrome tautomerase-related protein [Hymenobacter sp. M29]MDO7845796.1 L-dopachrome tautomerase-related protein [Hymenobacter sp. M29]